MVLNTCTVKLDGSNNFMKICLGQGKFELMNVNHSSRPRGIIGISFQFSLT